jgi:hypothetical protein
MTEIVDILINFSQTHNLWEQAKIAGTKSLVEYFDSEKDEAKDILPGHSIDDITFAPKSQQLTFYKHEERTFIISTRYSLHSKIIGPNIEIGYYVLDVNSNAVPIDDWLVMN